MDMKQTSNCSGFKAHRLVYHIYSVYTVYHIYSVYTVYIYIYIYIYSITYHEFGDCSMGIHVFYKYGTGEIHVVNTVHIKKLTILCEESA